ncbi:hypothetical protein SAMN05444392_101566 [Seinonella peptonophila]|uniref:Uncharacterized protein n=1 Tax=Seinonella peptonophila TaxID=112248 RepID=A0A1M4TP32_9BACL|nr:hypothetical protein [Seinonella peptonophila]SHE46231.1 hypothetical protein SAMN05444392_101566 [Seinonella peptonophila]
MSEEKHYYETFQVKDVIRYPKGQLILSNSTQGEQVYLQEIYNPYRDINHVQQLMAQLTYPYLYPIKQVIQSGNRLILVHPYMKLRPLTQLVTIKKPMLPDQAIKLYQNLLRTAIHLLHYEIPMVVHMEPEDIFLVHQPYLLFVKLCSSVGEAVEQFENSWRGLFPFLLTGKKDATISSLQSCLPIQIRELLYRSFEPLITPEDMLQLCEQAHFATVPRRKVHSRKGKKYWWIGITAFSMLGMGLSLHFVNDWLKPVSSTSVQQNKHADVITIPQISFHDQKISSLYMNQTLKQPTVVQFSFIQKEVSPFSAFFVTPDKERFGLHFDHQGYPYIIAGHKKKISTQDRASSTFHLKPKQEYKFQLIFQPNKPLYINVSSQDQKWLIVGPVLSEKEYQLFFLGNWMTHIQQVKVTKNNRAQLLWRQKDGGQLVHGNLVEQSKQIILMEQSQFQYPYCPTFHYRWQGQDDEKSIPLIELESLTSERFILFYHPSHSIELVQVTTQMKRLSSIPLPKKWNPKDETELVMMNQGERLRFTIQQDKKSRDLTYQLKQPMIFQYIHIRTDKYLLRILNK